MRTLRGTAASTVAVLVLLTSCPQAQTPSATSFTLVTREGRRPLPVTVANGQDLVALKIREIAEASGVPVFEDVALARSMYSQVSVDSMIPSQFYQAVAELVRVIYAKKPPRPNPGIA